MSQLIFNFPYTPDYSAENYMPLSFNAAALRALQTMPVDAGQALVIYGPEGVGKSHLLHVWAEQNRLDVLAPETLPTSLNQTLFAVDALDKMDRTAQEKLFHMFNHMKAQKGALVVTSRVPPAQLDLLPDLKSRLLLGQQVPMDMPTEAELKMLLAKWAMDWQIMLDMGVVNYIISRSGRSPSTLIGLFDQLNKTSLEQKRPITIPLVKSIFEAAEANGDFDE